MSVGMQEDMHRFRQFSSFNTKSALASPTAQCLARLGGSPCSSDGLAEATALSSINVRLNTLEVTAASLRTGAGDIVQHVDNGGTGSGTVDSPAVASQATQRLMCLAEQGLQLKHCLTTSIHVAESPSRSLL